MAQRILGAAERLRHLTRYWRHESDTTPDASTDPQAPPALARHGSGNGEVPVLPGKMGLLRVHSTKRKDTSGVKASRRARRVKVSADGTALVSRAGTLLLRELADGRYRPGGGVD